MRSEPKTKTIIENHNQDVLVAICDEISSATNMLSNFLISTISITLWVQSISCIQVATSTNGESDECNLNGESIRIAVIQQAPLVSCFQNLFGDWNCNGSNIEIMNIFEEKFNFTAEWIVLTDSQLGQDQQDNLTASASSTSSRNNQVGVFSLVQSGRAWMSANGLMRTLDRERNLMLSEPFDNFRLHFLLSKTLRDHDHIFLKPFDPETWFAILLSSVVIVPVFYIINRTSYHYLVQHNKMLASISAWRCVKFIWTRFWSKCKQKHRTRHHHKRHNQHQPSAKNEEAIELHSVVPKCFQISGLVRRRRDSSSSTSSSCLSMTTSFCDKVDQLLELGANFQLDTIESRLNIARRHRNRLLRHRLRQELHKARQARRMESRSGFSSLSYITWYVVSSLASQGGESEELPSASSTRILIAFWWFYLIVIVSIHSGVLTAILTFPKQNDFIQTLEDFLELTDSYRVGMKISVDQYSEVAHLLAKPENYIRSRLQQLFEFGYNHYGRIQGLSDFSKWNSNNERQIVFVDFKRHRERILDEIREGRLAHIEEKSSIDMTITREFFEHKPPKCLFKSSRFPIDVIPMSFLFGPRLPKACIKHMNFLLVNIMEMGLASKWRRRYEVPSNDCLNTVIINAGDIKKIELRQVVLAFWILFAGLVFGLASLVLEILWMITSAGSDSEHSENFEAHVSFLTESSDDSLGSSAWSSFSSDSDLNDDNDDDNPPRLGHENARRAMLRGRQPIKTLRLGGRQARETNQALGAPTMEAIMAAPLDEQDPIEWAKYYRKSKLKSCKNRQGRRMSFIERNIVGKGAVKRATADVSTAKREVSFRKGAIVKARNLIRRLNEGKLYVNRFSGKVAAAGAKRASDNRSATRLAATKPASLPPRPPLSLAGITRPHPRSHNNKNGNNEHRVQFDDDTNRANLRPRRPFYSSTS